MWPVDGSCVPPASLQKRLLVSSGLCACAGKSIPPHVNVTGFAGLSCNEVLAAVENGLAEFAHAERHVVGAAVRGQADVGVGDLGNEGVMVAGFHHGAEVAFEAGDGVLQQD